jgi:hypothetical protein
MPKEGAPTSEGVPDERLNLFEREELRARPGAASAAGAKGCGCIPPGD